MYEDFSQHTWTMFLKELLNEDDLGLRRDIQGEVWTTLAWTHCLEYEYQLRKEALRLCFEEGDSIQEALWTATQNETLDSVTCSGKQQQLQQQCRPAV